MRITICAYDAPNNIDGPTTWLKRLLPFLRENNIEARILFFANRVKELPTLKYFEELNFQCKLIPLELFVEEQIRLILEDVLEFPPNVFIANYFSTAGYASYYMKKAGIPTVAVLHNDDNYHRQLVKELFDRMNGLSRVVAVSKFLQETIQNFAKDASKIVCIPCGAPVPNHKAEWDGTKPLKLIYLGRLNNQQKRIDDVARALCRATKKLPNVEATIFGSGVGLQNVLKILKEEGDHSKISYGGLLSITEIQPKLLEHHVFILLSDYEGIPIAMMEAMGCGLVPICTDIKSGIEELLEDGKTGLVVSDRGDKFLEAVGKLLNNPERWKLFSQASKEKIASEYSESICNTRWLKLLEELASENQFVGTFRLPSVGELKLLPMNRDILIAQTRMPQAALIPIYRLKKLCGHIKRAYFH